jgi:predicted ATPase
LSIAGPGGQGKTRFALELARRAREERYSDYPAGVFSCFLSSVRDPGLVLATIAQTLNVKEQPGASALDALAQHLEGKRMLLLLDNLEHLLEAASELSQLLRRADGLTLLVTSRELMRVQGETAYSLPPLPDEEGVALFCERARLEPTADIAELCRRLEGLPLAIELAAARTAILTPAQLTDRLAHRLDLLKGGRDADPRQRTLRATIEWSYDLLTDDEQRLFRALSVFAGGCTLEAAEQVADADLDTLHSLVDKSLLRFTDQRYWMLETIREYAAQRLEEHAEADTAGARLADFVLLLASELDAGSDAANWAFAAEQDNVREALAWAERRDRLELRLDVIGYCWPAWWYRTHAGEGARLVESALQACAGERHVPRAKVLAAAAMFAFRAGEIDAALRYAEESLDIAREHGDANATVWPLILIGVCATERGDLEESARFAKRAVAVAHEVGNRKLIGIGLNNLGNIALLSADYAEAARLLEEALAHSREFGTADETATEVLNLGWSLHFMGRSADAVSAAREGLVLAQHVGNLRSVPDGLVLAGAIACRRGRPEAGARLVGAAAALSDRVGDVTEDDGTLTLTIPELVEALGDDHYALAVAEGGALSLDDAVQLALASLD